MDPGLTKSGFPKGLMQQVKCWQSVFLVTKMHFASLCHGLFYFWSAGVGGRLSSVRFWRLPACVQCRFTANRTVLWCSAQCIHGLADYMVRLASTAGANTQTRSYLKIAFILLSFYPFIPVIYLVLTGIRCINHVR